MDNDTDNDAVLGKILASYSDNRLIPFVGAGFSKNAKLRNGNEYPGWDEFVDKLYGGKSKRESNDPFYKYKEPLLSTEYWIAHDISSGNNGYVKDWHKECRKRLGEKVKKYFDTLVLKYNWVSQEHHILVNKFNTIYTSNWDDLLEKALEGCCKSDKYGVFYKYSDFHDKVKLKKEKHIIKIHGCLTDNKKYASLVATRSDYYDRMENVNPMYLKFQHAVSFYDFIFLGFSFVDTNIGYLLQQLNFMKIRTLKTKEKSNHNIFLAMDHKEKYEKKKSTLRSLFQKSFGIEIYFYNNLYKFFEKLERGK